MLTLKISESQVISLVDQLSAAEKRQILNHLLLESDAPFASACSVGERAFRKVCQARNLDPDRVTETEKLELVDSLLHENQ